VFKLLLANIISKPYIEYWQVHTEHGQPAQGGGGGVVVEGGCPYKKEVVPVIPFRAQKKNGFGTSWGVHPQNIHSRNFYSTF